MGRFYIPPRGIINPRMVPTRPVELIEGHPLSVGLVGLWIPALGLRDFSNSGNFGTNVGATPIGGTSAGPGFQMNGTSQYIALGSAGLPSGNSPYTLAGLTQLSTTTLGKYGIVGWGNYGTTNEVNALRWGAGGNDDTLVNYWWGNDLISPTPAYNDLKPHFAAATFDGTTRRLIYDGAVVASDTPTGHAAVVASPRLGSDNNADYLPGLHLAAWVYSIGLPPAQAAQLAAEPFGMLRERAPPILYSFASGGGGTLVGTAAATSTATGTLVGVGVLTGSAAATSTATGIIAGAGTLAGTAAAASTATGTLAGAGLLTGIAAATSTATGTLAGAGALTGTAAATSTATGTLSSGAYLVGTAAATSTATGTLTGAGALTGTAAATSTTTGTLAGAGTLAGTAAATSTAPAFLIGFGPISGIAAATSTVTGTLASRSWVFRAGRIVSIPADIRTAAIPADIRTVQ